MTRLPDLDARIRAMTDHTSTLLVEAGAGSGKTALLAGRVVCLLARGMAPRAIAAITFSELAAGELYSCICDYLDRLLDGDTPREIEAAFPGGISSEQLAHLAVARGAIGEITATTIHGFCQQLICPYPVEAALDPGARVMNEGEAGRAWEDRLQDFLHRNLDVNSVETPIAAFVLAVGTRAERVLREIADFLRRHRTARPTSVEYAPSLLQDLVDTVTRFTSWVRDQDYVEESTAALAAELDALATAYRERLGPGDPVLPALMAIAADPTKCSAHTNEHKWRRWGRKGKWEKAAVAAGRSKAEGGRVSAEGDTRYVAVGDAWSALQAMLGECAFAALAAQFDVLLEDYARYKREAALLDFDDLLLFARDLLRRDAAVREALVERYRAVHVDEFQDTDPVQAEILWLLCGEGGQGAPWTERRLRPGALFCVGDPKQAIYRFRGADVDTYVRAREAIRAQDPANVLEVTANFRSLAPILDWVNERFRAPLSAEGQPGFASLLATREPDEDTPRVAAVDVPVPEGNPSQAILREHEAAAVADLCGRLIGRYEIGRHERSVVRAGDIALLAPAGTELWRYERALEQAGIPVSSQAGKGFYRRQEIQDLIAIARAVSNWRDTVALGALLRGPLVGLTEEDLLDIVDGLPAPDHEGAIRRLTLWTEPDSVRHPTAREVLGLLQRLARRSNSTTPFELLSEAIDVLRVRPLLVARHPRASERALANLDLFLAMTRPYVVRGLQAFANMMRARWQDAESQVEGRPDAEEQAVQIITMHSAKGLEWPVVIPINTMTEFRSPSGILHDRNNDTLRHALGPIHGADYRALRSGEAAQSERECVRLVYVACTRAQDLLVLPRLSAGKVPWFDLLEMGLQELSELPSDCLDTEVHAPGEEIENQQDAEAFASEAVRIVTSTSAIERRQPSRHEQPDEQVAQEQDLRVAFVEGPDDPTPVRGGAERGILLHKLIEEVLTGELPDGEIEVARRAAELMLQLGVARCGDPSAGISPREVAETVRRTLALQEVAELRPRLQPEISVRRAIATGDGRAEVVVVGTADAVALREDGGIDAVIDWKSDIAPGIAQRERYRSQVREYLRATGAARGLVIYMTPGQVDEVRAD